MDNTLIYRLLILLVIALLLASCSLVRSKPLPRSFEQWMAVFPTTDLPLQAPVEIRWNEHLVPFIKAETDADCAFALGLVHAHLRLGQMALFREVVQSRVASHIGPFGTRIDHLLLAMDIFVAVDSIEAALEPETKQWLSDFVRGVNHYQNTVSDLPMEFKALKLTPQPWTVNDVIRMGRLVSADVNWFNWFSYLKLQEDPAWVRYWQKILAAGMGSTPIRCSWGSILRLCFRFFLVPAAMPSPWRRENPATDRR